MHTMDEQTPLAVNVTESKPPAVVDTASVDSTINATAVKHKRRVRPIDEVVAEVSPIISDAIDFMLTCSRVTISQSEAARRIMIPALRTILERIDIANGMLIGRSSRKLVDPCVYIMAVKMLVNVWNELARKYARSFGDIELPTPSFDSAQVAHWCHYKTQHLHHDSEFHQMTELVSRINDCRSSNEYDLLMSMKSFSMRSMLERQNEHTVATQAVITASLAVRHETRVDVQFQAVMEQLIRQGLDRANTLNPSDIFTHGEQVDARVIPIITIPSASETPILKKSPAHRRTASQITISFNNPARNNAPPRKTQSQPKLHSTGYNSDATKSSDPLSLPPLKGEKLPSEASTGSLTESTDTNPSVSPSPALVEGQGAVDAVF